METITVTSPWRKLGLSRAEYEALRLWETEGMGRAAFEEIIRALPDSWVLELRKYLLRFGGDSQKA